MDLKTFASASSDIKILAFNLIAFSHWYSNVKIEDEKHKELFGMLARCGSEITSSSKFEKCSESVTAGAVAAERLSRITIDDDVEVVDLVYNIAYDMGTWIKLIQLVECERPLGVIRNSDMRDNLNSCISGYLGFEEDLSKHSSVDMKHDETVLKIVKAVCDFTILLKCYWFAGVVSPNDTKTIVSAIEEIVGYLRVYSVNKDNYWLTSVESNIKDLVKKCKKSGTLLSYAEFIEDSVNELMGKHKSA